MKKQQKICIITTISFTIKVFLLETAAYLAKHGYEVTLVCDRDDALFERLPCGVKYVPVSMKRGMDGLHAISSIYTLYHLFKKEKFDIVQYSTTNAALYSSIAAKLAMMPVRLYCQWGIRYVGFAGYRRKFFKMLEKVVCILSTRIEPDSFGNQQFSIDEKLYSSENSGVVWNGSASGVNLERFDIKRKSIWSKHIRMLLGIPNNCFVVGFVGRLTRDKGINELLMAFRRLLLSYPTAILMLVGWLDDACELDQGILGWARETDNVIFCGSTDEVEKYVSAMDVFVLPSYREGFGSVIIEAEAMGIPVIASDIPGPREAMNVNDTGLMVRPKDEDALYEAIKLMIEQPDTRIEMGKKAVEFVHAKFHQQRLLRHIWEDRNMLLNNAVMDGVINRESNKPLQNNFR